MEKNLHDSTRKNDNKIANHGLQIINHPSYQPYSNRLLSWFDIRVFYVRVNNFVAPEYLTLNHIPLDPNTVLEVNGKRCSLQSHGISCRLKRNRVDKKFNEATFVSTDCIRLSGSVKFEVFDGENLILFGTLKMHDEKDDNNGKWSMSCESMVLCGNDGYFNDSMSPMIEVYVAGSFLKTPIILTKTLQIGFRKKHNINGMLDSIPEYDTTECQKDIEPQHDLQMERFRDNKYESKDDYNNYDNYNNSLFWNQREFMEDEDGALTWFNSGVRVGVGIGLGVCLGVGIGVGLLVRTYQSTTRNFRRWF